MNVLITSMAVAVVCVLGTTPLLVAEGGQQQPAAPPPPAPTAAGPRPAPVPPPQPAARAAAAPRLRQSRGFVAVGGVFQSEKASFTDTRTLTYNRESASQTGEYDIDGGVGLDLGAFARVWRNLGAGVAVTQVTRAGGAEYSARYPHPFFFNQARTATTLASDLDRTETGGHVSAAYLLPSSGRFGLTVFGGPSFFSMEQTVVADLTVTETYPYDTVAIAPGARSDISESAVGFHVGADATWYFTRRLGAGALLRYTSAKKNVAIGTGESFDLEAGGLQIGVGLRFKF